MSKNIVYEGWLTKSPPTKRIWRTKWRRRWFALRQSGDLPGQYFLDYYADRNCRRLKGTINLDLCEQVDAGLHMERAGNGSVDPKLRGSVFTIQTQSRTYHLEADCEEDMEKWVDAICRVCGLRSAEDAEEEIRPYQCPPGSVSPTASDGTGPYIPISECITGVRAQGRQTATFTFDEQALVGASLRRFPDRHLYTSQPLIRLHHAEVSENESNLSDDESNASQSIRNWSVTKSFTRTASNGRCGLSEDGPPVPPRPPKSLGLSTCRDNMVYTQRDSINQLNQSNPGNKLQEMVEIHDLQPPRATRRWSRPAPPSPGAGRLRAPPVPAPLPDDGGDISSGPANFQSLQLTAHDVKAKADALQYLDLDLPSSSPPKTKAQEPNRKPEIIVEKPHSAVDADSEDSAYRTVDFLKTEAFNITRADAEASRSNQH